MTPERILQFVLAEKLRLPVQEVEKWPKEVIGEWAEYIELSYEVVDKAIAKAAKQPKPGDETRTSNKCNHSTPELYV